MVAHPQEPLRMTEAEYLIFEETSSTHHEYVNGEVFAMTGASWNHNIINSNIQSSLNNQLTNRSCVVVASDLRLWVASKKTFRYPDGMVICGEPHFYQGRNDTIDNPTLIIEVLSPSTALEDRNAKLAEYTQLASVQEYLLIAQDEVKIERYLRQSSGEWLYRQISGLAQQLELPSIGCQLALATVYQKITFKLADD